MTAAAFLQGVILAAAALTCLIVVARRIAPVSMRRLQAALARRFAHPARARPLRAFGAWLQPRETQSGGCGSGGGCSTCGVCVTPAPPADDALPLRFTRKAPSPGP